MATNDAASGQRRMRDAWFAPINKDTAGQEIKLISKTWMTLALVVQLPIALISNLLPQIPLLSLSGMPWRHIALAGILFVLGYLYGAFKWRIVSRVVAAALLALLAYESYYYVTEHLEMLRVDLNYYALGFAALWRVLLLLLAVRGLWAALAAR